MCDRDPHGRKYDLLSSALIVILVLGLYWPILGAGHIHMDDPAYVFQNPLIQQGLTKAGVFKALTDLQLLGYWAPLPLISYMLDVDLFGGAAWGFHLTNLLLHLLNSILLFLLLRAFRLHRVPAVLFTLLWALHPLRAESVSWIAERKGLLASCLFLAAVLSYLFFLSKRRFLFYWLSLVAFLVGLSAKPTLMALPLLLIAMDLWAAAFLCQVPESLSQGNPVRFARKILLPKIPHLFAFFAVAVVTTIGQDKVFKLSHIGNFKTVLYSLEKGTSSYLFYLQKTLFPFNLGMKFLYREPVEIHLILLVFTLLTLTLIALAALLMGRKVPLIPLGIAWFFIMLFPMNGFILTGVSWLADRFTYIPHMGLALAGAGTFSYLYGQPFWRKRILGTILCVLALLFMITRNQQGYWKNDLAFFTRSLAIDREGVQPRHHFARAIIMESKNVDVYLDMQNPATRLAEEQLAQVLQEAPEMNDARYLLAMVLAETGRLGGAEELLRETLKQNPEFEQALYDLAVVVERQGRRWEAMELYTKAIAMNPLDLKAGMNLADLYRFMGNAREARFQYEQLAGQAPGTAEAYLARARLALIDGDRMSAVNFLRASLTRRALYPETLHAARKHLERLEGALAE